MKVSLATLVALGAAATVASASLTASAVLYRGNTFTAENSRLLSRLFFRKEKRGEQESGLKRGGSDGVDKGGRRALKEGRRNAAAATTTTAAAAEIDPVLRRKAVPTALKALGVSTAMAALVGTAAGAMLVYAVEGSEEKEQEQEQTLGGSEMERKKMVAEEEEVEKVLPASKTIKQFLKERFQGE